MHFFVYWPQQLTKELHFVSCTGHSCAKHFWLKKGAELSFEFKEIGRGKGRD